MSVTIKGTLYYADLVKINEMSDKYQFILGNLSDDACEALAKEGLSTATKNDKEGNDKFGEYITVKSSRPMRAYDTDGGDVSNLPIGNGTEAVAKVTPYDWKWRTKSGTSPSLQRLVVTKLELYEAEEEGEEGEEGEGEFNLEGAL
jgi:hypothetical protein